MWLACDDHMYMNLTRYVFDGKPPTLKSGEVSIQ